MFSFLLTPPPPLPSSLTTDYFVEYFTQKVKDISSSFTPATILQHPFLTSVFIHFITLSSKDVNRLVKFNHPTNCPLDPWCCEHHYGCLIMQFCPTTSAGSGPSSRGKQLSSWSKRWSSPASTTAPLSWLDFPASVIKPLQRIQNAAARLVFNLTKFSNVSPLFCDLHWLPVVDRIRFKMMIQGGQWNCPCLPPSIGQTTHPSSSAPLNYFRWTPGTAVAKSKQRSIIKITTPLWVRFSFSFNSALCDF